MKQKARNNPYTSLRNKHQKSCDTARFDIVSLVDHVPVDRVVMSIVFSFKVI